MAWCHAWRLLSESLSSSECVCVWLTDRRHRSMWASAVKLLLLTLTQNQSSSPEHTHTHVWSWVDQTDHMTTDQNTHSLCTWTSRPPRLSWRLSTEPDWTDDSACEVPHTHTHDSECLFCTTDDIMNAYSSIRCVCVCEWPEQDGGGSYRTHGHLQTGSGHGLHDDITHCCELRGGRKQTHGCRLPAHTHTHINQ